MRFVLYAVSTAHASEVAETAARLGWSIAAAVRNLPGQPVPPEIGEVSEVEELDPALLELAFAVPQTNPRQRRAATEDALRRGFRAPVTLADPTAVVAGSTTLGPGTYVGAGSVLGAGLSSGEGCLINRSCSLAHHVRLGDYVCTGPGVVMAGSCAVADGAFIGSGAVIAPDIQIGAGAFIGAGAVVIRDVAAGDTVVGNPARVLR